MTFGLDVRGGTHGELLCSHRLRTPMIAIILDHADISRGSVRRSSPTPHRLIVRAAPHPLSQTCNAQYRERTILGIGPSRA